MYPILIIGKPGSGKSASLKNLDPKTTFLISVIGKTLPFKSFKKDYIPMNNWEDKEGNFYASDTIEKILKCIDVVNKNRPDIKTIVVDDWQYILSHEFMRRVTVVEKNQYQKYTDIALHAFQTIMSLKNVRKDLSSIILAHSEMDQFGFSRLKTMGKMLNEKMDFEGEFEICLHARVNEGKYVFQTNHDNEYMARSPMEMFEESFIPNDLLIVKKAVESYGQ